MVKRLIDCISPLFSFPLHPSRAVSMQDWCCTYWMQFCHFRTRSWSGHEDGLTATLSNIRSPSSESLHPSANATSSHTKIRPQIVLAVLYKRRRDSTSVTVLSLLTCQCKPIRYNRPRHSSSGQSPASHRSGPGSSPRQVMWDLWTR
jgi:hypothetical protein